MKFRKKSVVIEAEQFLHGEVIPRGVCFGIHHGKDCGVHGQGHVHTIHAGQHVMLEHGDWVLPEPDGIHYYPCKPDIFAATYEPANAHPSASAFVSREVADGMAEALRLIDMEWKSDPTSTACFDFAIMSKARNSLAAYRAKGDKACVPTDALDFDTPKQ